MKKIAILLCSLGLAACSSTPKIIDKPVLYERSELIVPLAAPVSQSNVTWNVITPENYQTKVKALKDNNGNPVFFALSPQGYQNLSMNVAELRRYIQQQQAIIGAYQKYYKNESPPQKR